MVTGVVWGMLSRRNKPARIQDRRNFSPTFSASRWWNSVEVVPTGAEPMEAEENPLRKKPGCAGEVGRGCCAYP